MKVKTPKMIYKTLCNFIQILFNRPNRNFLGCADYMANKDTPCCCYNSVDAGSHTCCPDFDIHEEKQLCMDFYSNACFFPTRKRGLTQESALIPSELYSRYICAR